MKRSAATQHEVAPEPKKPAEGETQVGEQTLVLPPRTMPMRAPSREYPGLVVIQGREIGREYRLRRSELIVGRDDRAHLRIPDERVSRRHAALELSWDASHRLKKACIRDLGSTNGTHLNEEPIDRAELHEGDKLRIGDTVLKFVLHDELDARFHREIRHRIAYDQLTGLLTKESLYVAMESELKRCERFGLPMVVLMMDLDHFKSVNDHHGHLMGSQVLSEVGQLIREGMRGTDVSARYGGEEFLAYLSEVTMEQGTQAAERIRSSVEGRTFTRVDEAGKPNSVRITISIGIAEFPRHGSSLEALVAAADAALYRAKGEGRNRVCIA